MRPSVFPPVLVPCSSPTPYWILGMYSKVLEDFRPAPPHTPSDSAPQVAGAGHSDRSASMTLIRAARAAGHADATTAAINSTTTEMTTGKALGIRTSGK